MVLCIKSHGIMYYEAWDYVLDVIIMYQSFWLCRISTYELDLATRPIKVVLILCSPVSFKLINHLFSFPP